MGDRVRPGRSPETLVNAATVVHERLTRQALMHHARSAVTAIAVEQPLGCRLHHGQPIGTLTVQSGWQPDSAGATPAWSSSPNGVEPRIEPRGFEPLTSWMQTSRRMVG